MILKVAGGREVEHRSFALTDMVRWGYDGLRNTPSAFGDPVANAQAIPAIYRAARLRAEAVATLDLGCYRGSGPQRTASTSVWQAQMFSNARQNEYQTSVVFWETVEESLAYRGNAYIWKLTDPVTGRLASWYALHPNQVTCIGVGVYKVIAGGMYIDPVGKGKAQYTVDEDTILHIRGHGDGGTLEAPSPVAVFRESLGASLGRMRHESRMWKRGTAIQQAVVFPPEVTPIQAEQWRGQYAANYEGTDGDTTLVLGGGASVTPIGMTAVDAAYVDMASLTARDAAMIMGVPANLLGVPVQTRGVPNLEQDLATWLRFGLGPELRRIEKALAADPQVFPPGSQTQPWFNTEDFIRGDLITEANIMHERIQDGTLTPDEARALLGYEPHPDGLGATPQVTPVGGAANSAPIPAAFNPEPSD
jgi:HK97 family phage portal protein